MVIKTNQTKTNKQISSDVIYSEGEVLPLVMTSRIKVTKEFGTVMQAGLQKLLSKQKDAVAHFVAA